MNFSKYLTIIIVMFSCSVFAQDFIEPGINNKVNDTHYPNADNTITTVEDVSYITHVMTKEELGADLIAVAYGNGIYVIVGDSVDAGNILISHDGLTWMKIPGLSNVNFGGVKFFNGHFYSYGRWRNIDELYMPYYSAIWRSSDGINWTVVWSQIAEGNPQYGVQDIAYGDGKFVIAINDRLFVSSDNFSSLTQTTAISGTGVQDQFGLRKLSYGNGMFVAVNDISRSWAVNMAYSTDGTNWLSNNTEPTADCIAFVNNHFVSLSGASMRISADGIEWREVSQGKGTSIAYANGIYIFPNANYGHPNTDIRFSTDLGKNISKIYERNLGFDEWSDLRDVAAGENGFVIVGGAGILYTSFSDSEKYPKILGPDIIELEKGVSFEYTVVPEGFNPDLLRTNLEQHLGVGLPPGISQATTNYGISIDDEVPHFTGIPIETGEWTLILYAYEDGLGEQNLYVKKKVVFKVNTATSVLNENVLPSAYKLMQNYPNPFNPTSNIGFTIPASEHVVLKVFNVLGQEVITLVNEYKSAGVYDINFNAAALPSGVYFYTLKAGNYSETKKMVLTR